MQRLVLLCAGVLLASQGGPALAQTPPAEATPDAAAMARAQRAASNPMRVILEASKIKRRVAEGESTENTAAPAPAAIAEVPRKPAVRVAAPVAAPPNSSSRPPPTVVALAPPAPSSTSPVTALPPAVLAPIAAFTQPAAQTAQAAHAVTVEPAAVVEATVLAPSSAPSLPAALALVSPIAALNNTAAVPLPAPAAKPRMLSMVQPEIPVRVLQQVGRIGEVAVDLMLRRDGTVATVTLLPPASRQIQRYVVLALEKWRYEPLEQETLHRVQLVFNDEL